VSPASSTNVTRSRERNVTLSRPATVADLLWKKSDSSPESADGSRWTSLKIDVHPPAVPFSGLVAFVSPVSSKKNSSKCEPGRNCPFSGRLNGVACAAFASGFATNGALPSVAVSWIVIHFVGNVRPYVRRST
jgi:hypothetical protein